MVLRIASILPLACSLVFGQNPLQGLLGLENLKKAERAGVEVMPGERPDSVVLKFPASETPGGLTVAVPEAGRDWTAYRTFTFEFVSNSTIRWQLEIRNRKGQVFTYRVQPYQDVLVKAAIPMSFLTREYMNNRQFKGHWLSNWGNHIDLREVQSLAVRMAPNREVTLKLGPIALTAEDVPDEVFLSKPVVDAFGQWIPLEWPGKVHSLGELKQAWQEEDAALAKAEDFGLCSYGGWRERKERVTGFFHTTQVDGKWWLVDPDGHLFFSVGPDCVRYQDRTRVTGREVLFAKLPEGAAESADFYQANARLRYGDADFVANWKAKAAERLRAWGFNTVANWSDRAMFQAPGVPFVTNVSIGRARKSWQGFPDVYSEEYLQSATEAARAQCGPFREQPYLIGYFIGNEPRWPQRNLIDLIRNDSEPSATQEFVRGFLKQKGDSPATREALMETISRRYFQSVCEAIRKADPNHLILGIRWAGSAPDPVLKANDVFDVFSINIYRFEPPREQIERIYNLVKKPMLIGEFHFGAAERGYAPSLVMVKDQRERGVAYQYYVERTAALPVMVGAHYFQMVDQPVSGRYDGENYNLGLVNQLDLPYPEMMSFAKATHRRICQVHAGALAPTDRTARVR